MMRDLPKLRNYKRKRISSHDPTHGNQDFLILKGKEKQIIADIRGAGCIKHIWTTMSSVDRYYLRNVILRVWWDDEENPSIEVPIGDFFGIGHGICKNFVSLPLTMSPEEGKGFNCFFPMPYAKRARFEIDNDSKRSLWIYFYIDYEEYESLEEDLGRFHATWHRENPCQGISEEGLNNFDFLLQGKNEDFSGNYVILEAEGKGHYVGCNLNTHNLRETAEHNWQGEGDDMIFIDGDTTPTIFGTGTEDYFNTAYCPATEYNAPFHGVTLPGGKNWSGKISYYRYHILDPIYFEKSIKVTIEHGHANRRSDDISSTAYWYQKEPHKKFGPLPPAEERAPRKKPKEIKDKKNKQK
ncbi:MAG: glycoside hydrolase family 172 protein [Promethearchaeota archaeon]